MNRRALRPLPYRRPTMEEFAGINYASWQAQGLVAWYPLWNRAALPQLEMIRGVYSTNFAGAGSGPHLHSSDPQFGLVAKGRGDGDGAGTLAGYVWPQASYNMPGTYAQQGIHWGWSFWFKTLDLTSGANEYLMQYSFNASPWPGTAIGFETSQQMACNTNGLTSADAGFKTTMNPYDMRWHHCLFVQGPYVSGPPPPDSQTSSNTYYIDGQYDSEHLNGCTPAAILPGAGDFILNCSDQGDAPNPGSVFDFRLYIGLKGNLASARSDQPFAQHLYQPATRWDLYKLRSPQDALLLGGAGPTGGGGGVPPFNYGDPQLALQQRY